MACCSRTLLQQDKLLIISDSLYINLNESQEKAYNQCGHCPVCTSRTYRYHARYFKYYYSQQIPIIRVRCCGCKATHALIPEFSLPGTSIGTFEAQEYLKRRYAAQSQTRAAVVFTGRELGERYGRRFEKRVRRQLTVAKAVLSYGSTSGGVQVVALKGLLEEEPTAILKIDAACNAVGLNPLFFSRRSILTIRQNKTGPHASRNRGAIWSSDEALNSGKNPFP